MDANGQLLPTPRNWVYATYPGRIIEFGPGITPNAMVAKGQEVIKMQSLELASKLHEIQTEIDAANAEYNALTRDTEKQPGRDDMRSAERDREAARVKRDAKIKELNLLRDRTNAILQSPGEFWLRSPLQGKILSSDFQEVLLNRSVKEDEQLLRVGYISPGKPDLKDWEIELKIPQKHVGQVLAAFKTKDPGELLDVDLLLETRPTATYKGKLARAKIASQANPDKNAHDETEPVVLAWVRVSGEDIPADAHVPTELLLAGTEVHARVRCGNHAMGYSLFYGVWEFVYEKIVFFF
jgi:hypothetical protein